MQTITIIGVPGFFEPTKFGAHRKFSLAIQQHWDHDEKAVQYMNCIIFNAPKEKLEALYDLKRSGATISVTGTFAVTKHGFKLYVRIEDIIAVDAITETYCYTEGTGGNRPAKERGDTIVDRAVDYVSDNYDPHSFLAPTVEETVTDAERELMAEVERLKAEQAKLKGSGTGTTVPAKVMAKAMTVEDQNQLTEVKRILS